MSNLIMNVIMAALLPPVCVYLLKGWGTDVIIDIILTILGFFPGVLYALYWVFYSPIPIKAKNHHTG
ncbi:hypothetical protein Kpol_526p47 [Vanderwaltozyma polyspora DSM 70294]|uniref:Plasma membrane proteolipid 3 n=1 Tax=Vanderwaltozyma polyspora (strain ATCC 22028 / DSM 70294 / BCRC 21397 / CBS 2163 / NBRC 10782 / NRRL Y-8283 / UCD 57-17) TaxID=436907 RepID=A7TLV2_VANPO|nr:uncharacterized protein Kpol_526p47 [Vanderwaltozyma polyspora DSM 70294]EDO16794.1 hypothetical protein Kpol_526p47 [Vanderwaltozyma polyspora DSM 70294]